MFIYMGHFAAFKDLNANFLSHSISPYLVLNYKLFRKSCTNSWPVGGFSKAGWTFLQNSISVLVVKEGQALLFHISTIFIILSDSMIQTCLTLFLGSSFCIMHSSILDDKIRFTSV